jgi:hypothetical protein
VYLDGKPLMELPRLVLERWGGLGKTAEELGAKLERELAEHFKMGLGELRKVKTGYRTARTLRSHWGRDKVNVEVGNVETSRTVGDNSNFGR